MLGIFSAKSDHPLADAKEARRVGAELATLDAAAAVDQATAWFESLAASSELRADLRFERLLLLDAAAAPQARRLARDYVGLANPSRAQESRLWQINRAYWTELARAYEGCRAACDGGEKGSEAIKARLDLLYAHLLCAYAGRLKWNQLHYSPLDGGLWAAAGRAYLAAFAAKLATRNVMLYAGSETTPQAEYLKMLVFHATSMDTLLPIEIELAERLIAHFLPHFIFTAEVRPDNVYWVDAAQARPPARLARQPATAPTLRFFSTGRAAAAVAELRADIAAQQALPADVALGGQYAVAAVLAVLDHLALCWSPTPPMRSHKRHRIESQLSVVAGVAALHERLANPAWSSGAVEAWTIADVGHGGIGAIAPTSGNDWIRVGALIGMQPDGGDNWLMGVVRRYARESETQAAVGIETLSKTPRAIVADCGGLPTEGILLDPPAAGTLVRIVAAASAWEPGIAAALELDGQRLRLQPVGIAESVPGHVIGRYALSVA